MFVNNPAFNTRSLSFLKDSVVEYVYLNTSTLILVLKTRPAHTAVCTL